MSEIVLRIEGVGKRYAAWGSSLARFASWFGVPAKPVSEYWAVKDISFSLRSGEALALIGQNGAGKSTLLKLITGTVRPTVGNITVNGRISAILELGLGFNPEFTGRQNVYQAGGLMGFAREELARLMPEIEAFAELGDFFDQPLRVYSSGMQARLAFSLATCVRPDVLIVDEVLSVGDSYFQHKSFDRIRQFKKEKTAILFVTHSMGDIRALCDRVLLIDKGEAIKDGLPDEVIDFYNALIADKENAKLTIEQRRQKNGWLASEYGSMDVVAEDVRLLDAKSLAPVSTVTVGQQLILETTATVMKDIPRLILGYRITDRTGHVVWGSNTWHTNQAVSDLKIGEQVIFRLHFDCDIGPGSYAWSFGLVSSDTHLDDCYHKFENKIVFDVVNANSPYFIGCNALKSFFDIERKAHRLPVRLAIISTPRSGNTWLRILLSKLYSAKEYAVHHPEEFDWAAVSSNENTILQLHWLPDESLLERLSSANFRVVSIARHPLDVLLSILQFSPKEPQTSRWLEGFGGNEESIRGCEPNSDAFLNYATGPRARALLSVSMEWSRRDDVVLVRYEDLVRDPMNTLRHLMQEINSIPCNADSLIATAVQQTSLSALRKTSGNGHFWQGTPDIWCELLNVTTALRIREANPDVFEHFGYDVARSGSSADENFSVRWRERCR